MKRTVRLLFFCLIYFATSSYAQESRRLQFVQLCDSQLGMGGYENDLNSLRLAVKKINDLNPDFVLICGDLVNIPSDSDYADFLNTVKELKMPLYCVPGNHDAGGVPDEKTLKYYRKTIGKDYYSFRKKGSSFIAVNTQLWKVFVAEESDKHDLWLKNTIAKAAKKKGRIIVFGHIPIYVSDPEEKEAYYNFPQAKRKEFLKLLEQHHVSAYLSGHSHTTIINNYKGIQLVSGETTSRNFDKRPLGFRLWNLSSDSLSHQFVPLD